MDQQNRRTALVSGSSNGIGEAVAKGFAKLDYELVITGRNVNDIKRVADECAKLSPSKRKPLEIEADFSNEADVDRLAKQTLKHFDGYLNVLINNAGISIPRNIDEPKECYEAYKKVMQVNMNASVQLTLLLAGALKEAAIKSKQTSSIINVSSVAARRTSLTRFAYSCSKAALNMFTANIAYELAPLVRINTVSPGPIETKIIERAGIPIELFKRKSERSTLAGRIGQPEEVAECILFLSDSSRASYVNGADLVVDGGCLVTPITWDEK